MEFVSLNKIKKKNASRIFVLCFLLFFSLINPKKAPDGGREGYHGATTSLCSGKT
jgi:hypothetical protein